MSRKYPQSDIKILYGLAAARCAFPKCRHELVLEGTSADKTKQIGKIAHIVAHSQGGPRSDPTYPKHKLDTYENWLLLCPTCHDTVDAHEGKHDVQFLRNLKIEHERWVQETLNDSMSEVTFAELEVAIRGIAQQKADKTVGFTVITPDEKIAKNQLSDATRAMIAMGLMQGSQVKAYLESVEQSDPGFINRLIAGFKEKYIQLISDAQLNSDAIFEDLLDFSCGSATDFRTRAAGLALLSHLFETCEVFKK
ncbi:MAG: HNH endonuclease [Gammaproteobacteria bacterium]|nr:HNH endonuclease [Gammaproteobacteria bacterium]